MAPAKSSKSDVARCSGCTRSIKTASDAKLHPLLKVLICKVCLEAYGSGDFSKFPDGVDENGDDNFCRVCVDGGDLFCCDNTEEKCRYTFCRECIKRINPDDPVLKRDNDNSGEEEVEKWTCIACEPSKADKARREALTIIERLQGVAIQKSAGDDHSYANKKRKSDDPKEPLKTKSSENTRADKPQNGVKRHETDGQRERGRSEESMARQRKKLMQQLNLKAKERSKSSKVVELVVQRDPEATSMPPLEIPKQPKTSLRNLSGPRVSFSQALATSTPIKRDKPIIPTKPHVAIHRMPFEQPQSILRSRSQKRVSVSREGVETSIVFADKELKDRLKEFMAWKDMHLKKVDRQFSDVAEHFFTLDPEEGSELILDHINSMRRAIQEVNNMFINMESLWEAHKRNRGSDPE